MSEESDSMPCLFPNADQEPLFLMEEQVSSEKQQTFVEDNIDKYFVAFDESGTTKLSTQSSAFNNFNHSFKNSSNANGSFLSKKSNSILEIQDEFISFEKERASCQKQMSNASKDNIFAIDNCDQQITDQRKPLYKHKNSMNNALKCYAKIIKDYLVASNSEFEHSKELSDLYRKATLPCFNQVFQKKEFVPFLAEMFKSKVFRQKILLSKTGSMDTKIAYLKKIHYLEFAFVSQTPLRLRP